MDKRGIPAEAARRLKEVDRTHRIGIEVIKGYGSRQIVRGLRRGVDDRGRPQPLHQGKHTLAVADIELMVREVRHQRLQPFLVPAVVSLRAEEHGALIVIRSVDQKTLLVKMESYLGSDESRGACDFPSLMTDASSNLAWYQSRLALGMA